MNIIYEQQSCFLDKTTPKVSEKNRHNFSDTVREIYNYRQAEFVHNMRDYFSSELLLYEDPLQRVPFICAFHDEIIPTIESFISLFHKYSEAEIRHMFKSSNFSGQRISTLFENYIACCDELNEIDETLLNENISSKVRQIKMTIKEAKAICMTLPVKPLRELPINTKSGKYHRIVLDGMNLKDKWLTLYLEDAPYKEYKSSYEEVSEFLFNVVISHSICCQDLNAAEQNIIIILGCIYWTKFVSRQPLEIRNRFIHKLEDIITISFDHLYDWNLPTELVSVRAAITRDHKRRMAQTMVDSRLEIEAYNKIQNNDNQINIKEYILQIKNKSS